MFLKVGVLKIYIANLQESKFIEITFRHECSPVKLLHIFRSPFPKKTSVGLILVIAVNDYLDKKIHHR